MSVTKVHQSQRRRAPIVEPANATASAMKVLLACKRTPAPVDVAAFVGPEPDPVLVWLPVGLYKII